MSLRMIMVGPPGAGKGTQAIGLCERHNIVQVSTGDLFRAHAAAGDELGQLADSYTSRGELVPDEVTNAMVRERLAQPDMANGFLLDGYPRNPSQVGALDVMLIEQGLKIDLVLELTADDDEVFARLLNRAKEQGRADDTEEIIRHRIEIYHASTKPLLDVYQERGILLKVDGGGSVEEVAIRIDATIDGFLSQSSRLVA